MNRKLAVIMLATVCLAGCHKKTLRASLPGPAHGCSVSERDPQGRPVRLDCTDPRVKHCRVTGWDESGDAVQCACGLYDEGIDAQSGKTVALCSQ